LPAAKWQGFTVHYRHRETVYHIKAARTAAAAAGSGDRDCGRRSTRKPGHPLADDRRDHNVEVGIGPQSS